MRCVASAGLALLLLCVAPVAVQGVAEEPSAETFLQRSLKAGRIQASLARLASIRAHDAEVRRFAAAIHAELEARNARLAQLARAEGIAEDPLARVPAYSSHEIPRRTLEFHRLRVRSGRAFDKQFLNSVIVSYENAIRGYEAETKGDNNDVRALAEEALPELRRRLAEARRLLENIADEPR